MLLVGWGRRPWERSHVTVKAIFRTMGSVEFDTEEWPYLTYSLTDQSVCCFENRLGIREWGPRKKQKNHLEDY